MGPTSGREIAQAREADLDLAVCDEAIPEGVRVHLKLDTGMGRWGLSELPAPPVEVVGLMSHLATAGFGQGVRAHADRALRAGDGRVPASDPPRREQRSRASASRSPTSTRPAAGSRSTASRPSASRRRPTASSPRCAGTATSRRCGSSRPGESTGYGRRFVAEEPTWVGIVPVGYADGFRRDLTGAEVRVAGEPRRVVGTVSMDALAVELDRELPVGTPVTLVGHGVLLEDHARVADTINYELSDRDQLEPHARAARGPRCVSWRRRSSPARRPGSSAARFATSCSGAS